MALVDLEKPLEGRRIFTYDTTLRDGAQTSGVRLSVNDKLVIARKLDSMGFDFIEGGWPGANPVDRVFFKEVKGIEFRNSRLTAFGMTRRMNGNAANDETLDALLRTDLPILTIFGKSWDLHVTEALETTLEKNLNAIYDTMIHLRGEGREVVYDAEHFFDGFRYNPEYALETLLAARNGGAGTIVLCDTNGGSIPEFIKFAVEKARETLGNTFPLGVHVHNDAAGSVANTIAALKAGASQAQGTFCGTGERNGNVDFSSLLPTAVFKYGADIGKFDLTQLTPDAHFIARQLKRTIPDNDPYVGKNSFSHKGGVHVSAVNKIPCAYEHIDPSSVGNIRRFEHSDQGGGANIVEMARKHGFSVDKKQSGFRELVEAMKQLQLLGDAQEYLLLHQFLTDKPEPFIVTRRRVVSTDDLEPEAMVTIKVGDKLIQTAATGNGTYNAFDNALRKALGEEFPEVIRVVLVDYDVKLPPTERAGTAATVVVETEFKSNGDVWTSYTSGVNLEETQQRALIDSYKYYLLKSRL